MIIIVVGDFYEEGQETFIKNNNYHFRFSNLKFVLLKEGKKKK